MTAVFTPVASCQTIKERVPQYVELPPGTKGYLTEKVLYALRTPEKRLRMLPGGQMVESWLRQIVVSGTIKRDEEDADYRWLYKAEVSFDMWPVRLDSEAVPIPFLSSNRDLIARDGPNRRHSNNPFPPGFRVGHLRRPDVIIVRNKSVRWPGRATQDHTGQSHADNLERLVEIKFPGDDWGKGQEKAYQPIAGGTHRMSVLDVSDCDGDFEKAKQAGAARPAAQAAGAPGPRRAAQDPSAAGVPVRAPIRSTKPIAEKTWYEPWLNEMPHRLTGVARAVASLWSQAKDGTAELSAAAGAWVGRHAPWLVMVGRWAREAATDTWVWVDHEGEVMYRYGAAQLRAMWRAVQEATDLTWDMLRQIDWGQVLTYMTYAAKGVAIVVLTLGAAYMVCVLAAPVFAALAALVAIVGSSGTAALAALAAMLGVQQMAAQ